MLAQIDTPLATATTLAVLAIAAFLAATRVGSVLVREYEAGIRVRRGRVVGPLAVGRNRYWKPTTEVFVVDQREQTTHVPVQEVLSADGVAIKISLMLTWRVADPALYLTVSEQPLTTLYGAAQLALREAVAGAAFDALMDDRKEVEAALRAPVAAAAGGVGLEVERVAVKDWVLGGELKRAMNEVVRARAEARAQVERTRGETAATRALVNAAQLIERHAGLYELRLLDAARAAADGDKNSLVLGLPQGVVAPATREE